MTHSFLMPIPQVGKFELGFDLVWPMAKKEVMTSFADTGVSLNQTKIIVKGANRVNGKLLPQRVLPRHLCY